MNKQELILKIFSNRKMAKYYFEEDLKKIKNKFVFSVPNLTIIYENSTIRYMSFTPIEIFYGINPDKYTLLDLDSSISSEIYSKVDMILSYTGAKKI